MQVTFDLYNSMRCTNWWPLSSRHLLGQWSATWVNLVNVSIGIVAYSFSISLLWASSVVDFLSYVTYFRVPYRWKPESIKLGKLSPSISFFFSPETCIYTFWHTLSIVYLNKAFVVSTEEGVSASETKPNLVIQLKPKL